MLAEKLKLLPDQPGVYLMLDHKQRVLYVGKSASLRQRVRSYFQASAEMAPKIRWMVSKVQDLETIVVETEVEALILECNLIKKHRPYFNTKYRDDKRYPLLEVTTSEEFPKIRVVRRQRNSRNRYFGPFPDAGALRRTVTVLQKMFQIRTCNVDMSKSLARPCLDYYLGMCTAPCTQYVSQPDYRHQVEQALDYLEGNSGRLMRRLRQEMEEQAQLLNFERCARLRDMLSDLERTAEKQIIVSDHQVDQDFLAVASAGELICGQVLQVREGKILGHRCFFLESPGGSEGPEQMSAFLKQYYGESTTIPRQILVNHLPEEISLLETWLQQVVPGVKIRLPQRGKNKDLLAMASKNAQQALQQERLRPSRGIESRRLALEELQQALQLKEYPWRMECVDISNFQGRQAVGSLVVFEQGLPRRDHYRRFRIRSGDTPDDFRMMREALTRRLRHGAGEIFESLPELLVVDGGKGQLGEAVQVLRELGLDARVQVAGLAKEHEWIFLPGQKDPIILPKNSRALLMLTHMRDETHRFAVQYHRKLRQRDFKSSVLDLAPGIGRERKQALLKHFGSVQKLLGANSQELAQVEGLGPKLARQLFEYLKSAGSKAKWSEQPSNGQQIFSKQEKKPRHRRSTGHGAPPKDA